MAFHRHPLQRLCFWLHPYCAKFGVVTLLVNRLVADKRYSCKDWFLFAGDDKETAFVRHAAGDECGVLWREQGDVGVGHGLAVGVYDGALVAVGGFLRTLDGDFCAVDAHADGIEAYHLTDGIGNGLATNGGSDAEVLQFVVEEVDFVVGALGIQLAQGIAERHIIIFTRDAHSRRTVAYP